MKLHHVDGPCVAGEFRHHLASSQIPELGQGGWRSGLGWATPSLLPHCPNLTQTLPSSGATFTVWSSAAEANHFPSGLKRRQRTAWLWPWEGQSTHSHLGFPRTLLPAAHSPPATHK